MFFEKNNDPILVIAPHPDDETLGAGGFLLRARKAGIPIHWLIVTRMCEEDSWPEAKIQSRQREIDKVINSYGFSSTRILSFASTRLDTVAMGDLVAEFSKVVSEVKPGTLLLPHRGDAHSDHAAVHDAGSACAKWFRYPSVKNVWVYETLSETDAAIQDGTQFNPNIYVDISSEIDEKLKIMAIFEGEMGDFPFPRSEESIRSLAKVRGSACGSNAAEAFMLLRTRF